MGVVVNFNAGNVDPSIAPEPLETGRYPVAIISSEEKDTKDKQGNFIELVNQVVSGPMKGRKITDRLNIKNNSTEAVRIAWAQLSAICHVTGRLQIGSTQELHGIPYMIDVVKTPRSEQPGKFNNEIIGYYDSQGRPPAKGQPGNAGGASTQQSGNSEWDGGGQTQQTATQQQSGPSEAEVQERIRKEVEAKIRAEMEAKAGGGGQQTQQTEQPATTQGDASIPDWAK